MRETYAEQDPPDDVTRIQSETSLLRMERTEGPSEFWATCRHFDLFKEETEKRPTFPHIFSDDGLIFYSQNNLSFQFYILTAFRDLIYDLN